MTKALLSEHFSLLSDKRNPVFSHHLCKKKTNRTYMSMNHIPHIPTLLFAGMLILTGCDMIEYHPYDMDIDGETDINATNIRRIESTLEGRK